MGFTGTHVTGIEAGGLVAAESAGYFDDGTPRGPLRYFSSVGGVATIERTSHGVYLFRLPWLPSGPLPNFEISSRLTEREDPMTFCNAGSSRTVSTPSGYIAEVEVNCRTASNGTPRDAP